MTTTNQWHGQKLTLSKRKENYSADGIIEAILNYEGHISTLRANAPAIGAPAGEGELNCLVENVEIAGNGEGDKAVMTVTASNRTFLTVDGSGWQRTELDIRYHKIFNTDGTWELTDTDRVNVETAIEGQSPAVIAALSTNAKQLFTRLQRGQTNYAVYIPTCHRTSWTISNPELTDGCGNIEAPPFAHPEASKNGVNYTYVKTEDEVERRGGIYERKQVWLGFDQVDIAIIGAT